MAAPVISTTGSVDLCAAFRLRCEARAYLYSIGDLDLHDAVDELQAGATAWGLVEAIGQDAVQWIMADAFRSVKGREIYLHPPRPQPAPAVNPQASMETIYYAALRRRGVPRVTTAAADYVRRQGDADALRRWLEEHRDCLTAILEYWPGS